VGEGPVELIERPNPAWPIARAAITAQEHGTPELAELARLPQLGERWRERLSRRIRP
jgi:hypothetical protein